MKKHKLLVTGCGRSGTSYICSVLKQCKQPLDLGHESWIGKDGIASWLLAFDKHPPRGPQNVTFRDFDIVFHQVRHPLGVISSLHTAGEESWEFFKQCVPELREHSWSYMRRERVKEQDRKTQLLACVKCWYYWNLQSERIAQWTYQVEALPVVFEQFCRKVGIQYDPEVFQRNLKTDSRKTRQDYVMITWDDISSIDDKLCVEIQRLARRYGYE